MLVPARTHMCAHVLFSTLRTGTAGEGPLRLLLAADDVQLAYTLRAQLQQQQPQAQLVQAGSPQAVDTAVEALAVVRAAVPGPQGGLGPKEAWAH